MSDRFIIHILHTTQIYTHTHSLTCNCHLQVMVGFNFCVIEDSLLMVYLKIYYPQPLRLIYHDVRYLWCTISKWYSNTWWTLYRYMKEPRLCKITTWLKVKLFYCANNTTKEDEVYLVCWFGTSCLGGESEGDIILIIMWSAFLLRI